MMFKFYTSSAFSATEQVKLVDPPSLPFSLKHAKLYHASFKLSQKKEKELREITTFNIEARYNSYKLAFFKKATKEYAQKWLKKTKEIYQWIEKML